MWVAVAVAAVGAGAQLYASDKASDRAEEIANQELAQKQEQFDYQKSLQEPFYKEALPAYRSLVSGVTGQIDPNTGKAWTPTTSPAFQWQKEQQEKDMGRRLRALGRGNSTWGMNTMADSNRNLLASEWDKQLGRLQSLSGFATRGADALSGVSDKRVGAIGEFNEGLLSSALIKQQGINNAVQTGLSGVNMAASLYKQPPVNQPSQPALNGMEKGNSYGVTLADTNKWNAGGWGY